ncbi:apolipoprotein L4-like [Haliotis rubra]|uniref:apolipoprotein L4-like n=1 Tax=Haliotis rubra TaxID=36100 RepID=UPI001EE54F2B|nr:apolipoprotein L4-like [Haliotis rubra]
MGNSRDDSLEQTSSDCRDAQKRTARKLRTLARALREKQRQMNIAKVSFHSAGIVSGGLSLAGAILAPFTGGLSIALIAVGGGMGSSYRGR